MRRDSVFIKKGIIVFILCIFASLGTTFWYTARMNGFQGFRLLLASVTTSVFWYREIFLLLVFIFIGLHFLIPIKKMYNWMFKYRWYIGIGILLFLTLMRFHGESISFYNNFIQPGTGDELANPIFGVMRPIRTDDYIVSTPNILASQYGITPFGTYNNVLRATDTLNLVTGVYIGLPTLILAPWELVYAFLPVEFAYSFCWYAPLIFGFLMMMELFYVISKNKLVAFTGAVLIVFSSWYLWWGFSVYMINAPGVIVCLAYYLKETRWSKKILYALGTALCFGSFIVSLYPAWQVPIGYMFLAIGIWFIHDNWDVIKSFTKKDWFLLAGSLLLCFVLVFVYFYSVSEYVEVINNTAYPGARFDSGSFALNKIFYYIQAPFYAYKDIGNPCEVGVFFSLFPIPSIAVLWCWVKEKKKDWLTAGLLIVQIPMLFYVTCGVPEFLAKITLLSYSIPARMVDIIGLIQIYFIVILFSRYKDTIRFHWVFALLISMITAGVAVYYSMTGFSGYLDIKNIMFMMMIIIFLGFTLLFKVNQNIQKLSLIMFVVVSISTGFYIRPISVGLSAIYSKPIAKEIQEIVSENTNTKWLTLGGRGTASFTVSCGAPTINSVNTYPNISLWKKLDPNNQFNDIYNRYAHIDISFVHEKTNFELLFDDAIKINLSYEDISKTGANYLFVNGELEFDTSNGFVSLEKVYDEYGASIYKLIY